MTDAIVPIIISSLGTASAFGVVATFLLKQQAKATADRLADAEAGAREAVAKVATLRDGAVKRVADKLDKHVASDKSQTYGTKLDSMAGQLNKMDGKLDRIAETTANQDARITGAESYVGNVDKSLQRHKEVAHHA